VVILFKNLQLAYFFTTKNYISLSDKGNQLSYIFQDTKKPVGLVDLAEKNLELQVNNLILKSCLYMGKLAYFIKSFKHISFKNNKFHDCGKAEYVG